ncbi:hypothetical protein F5Y18DRAFT_410824 [Xylariaceae sp. FL1019]|nr:hypothetical protein F5Y18DRAFT_410824 [Xylariaceae sp. FL1019]
MKTLGVQMALRDITQAYTQSKDALIRHIYARLPKELESRYPEGSIMRVVKKHNNQTSMREAQATEAVAEKGRRTRLRMGSLRHLMYDKQEFCSTEPFLLLGHGV